MTDEGNPYLPPIVAQLGGTQRRSSLAGTWITYYSIAFLLLFFTMPATSHSNNWSGIVPAFGILMFGAYRLAAAGAKTSVLFIFGCGTSFMFALRFISMGRFSLWLQYQAPSTVVLLGMWCAICLALGGSAAAIGYLVNRTNGPADISASQATKKAS